MLYAQDVPAEPLLGPDAMVGTETVSPPEMLTDSALDQLETVEVSVAHRAMAFTEYVPEVDQLLEALVVPAASQPELVLSPQSK